MLARLVAISALATGALAIASPTLAQQRAPVQAPSNIQQPEGQQRDARQAEARRERDRNGQSYTVRGPTIRELTVSSLMVTLECAREDRFGDNRYEFHFTAPRRDRESRIARFPREWLAERLVETAYEVQQTPGAAIELGIMRSSRDPSDGNLRVISSFSIVYPD